MLDKPDDFFSKMAEGQRGRTVIIVTIYSRHIAELREEQGAYVDRIIPIFISELNSCACRLLWRQFAILALDDNEGDKFEICARILRQEGSDLLDVWAVGKRFLGPVSIAEFDDLNPGVSNFGKFEIDKHVRATDVWSSLNGEHEYRNGG